MSETRRRWLAIVNPACSGMRDRKFRDTWLRRLRYTATKVVICEKPEDAPHIIAEESAFDSIAVVGGDGTVFDILPALDPSRHCLTVCPAGRGNSLARALGFASMPLALGGLKRTENEARLVKQYDEVYEFLVLPAFLLLVGEACMNERRRRAAA